MKHFLLPHCAVCLSSCQGSSVKKRDAIQTKSPTEKQEERRLPHCFVCCPLTYGATKWDMLNAMFDLLCCRQPCSGLASIGRELRKELEEDDCCVVSCAPAASSLLPRTTSAGAVAKPQPKPKQRNKVTPKMASSKVRKDTMKHFVAARPAAYSAIETGKQTLEEATNLYGTKDNAMEADGNIKVLSHRLTCLELLMDMEQSKSADKKSSRIFQLLEEDDFFSDQHWEQSHVQTWGYIEYVRQTMLDLQRTAEAVQALGEQHKEALNVVKEVAMAVSKSAKQWSSNVAALKKARDLEKKQLEKEEERQRKAEEKAQKSEAAKEKRRLEQEDKKRQKELEKEKKDKENADNTKEDKTKRRKKQTAEIEESDYAILKSVVNPDWPREFGLNVVDDAICLAAFIAKTSGRVPALARFRRSSVKKVLEAACIHYSLRLIMCVCYITVFA